MLNHKQTLSGINTALRCPLAAAVYCLLAGRGSSYLKPAAVIYGCRYKIKICNYILQTEMYLTSYSFLYFVLVLECMMKASE